LRHRGRWHRHRRHRSDRCCGCSDGGGSSGRRRGGGSRRDAVRLRRQLRLARRRGWHRVRNGLAGNGREGRACRRRWRKRSIGARGRSAEELIHLRHQARRLRQRHRGIRDRTPEEILGRCATSRRTRQERQRVRSSGRNERFGSFALFGGHENFPQGEWRRDDETGITSHQGRRRSAGALERAPPTWRARWTEDRRPVRRQTTGFDALTHAQSRRRQLRASGAARSVPRRRETLAELSSQEGGRILGRPRLL
jgi:hypothetical protein